MLMKSGRKWDWNTRLPRVRLRYKFWSPRNKLLKIRSTHWSRNYSHLKCKSLKDWARTKLNSRNYKSNCVNVKKIWAFNKRRNLNWASSKPSWGKNSINSIKEMKVCRKKQTLLNLHWLEPQMSLKLWRVKLKTKIRSM